VREARRFLNYSEMARRLLIGQTTEVIAQEMDLTESWVRHVTKTDAFMQTLRSLEKRVWSEFDAATRRDSADLRVRMKEDEDAAYDDLREIMFGSNNEKLRASLLTEHLERMGHGAIKQLRVQGTIQPSTELVDLIGSTIQHLENARQVIEPGTREGSSIPERSADSPSIQREGRGSSGRPSAESQVVALLPESSDPRIH